MGLRAGSQACSHGCVLLPFLCSFMASSPLRADSLGFAFKPPLPKPSLICVALLLRLGPLVKAGRSALNLALLFVRCASGLIRWHLGLGCGVCVDFAHKSGVRLVCCRRRRSGFRFYSPVSVKLATLSLPYREQARPRAWWISAAAVHARGPPCPPATLSRTRRARWYSL